MFVKGDHWVNNQRLVVAYAQAAVAAGIPKEVPAITINKVCPSALTAIALGSWLGGRIADQVNPRRLIGPSLGVSGAVVALTPAVLRTTAEWAPVMLLLIAPLTILLPGALLSAVTPIVTKLRLTSLAETGTVVGRLSGVGTVGAIVGTVLTGFVLVSDERFFPAVRRDGPIALIVALTTTAALVGLGIGETEYWGRGYGTDAMNVLLRYAFTEINLRRVTLTVFEYNPRAIRSYEKAGFCHEGRLRKVLNKEGRRWDVLYMGILREEWLEVNHDVPSAARGMKG